MRLLFSMLYLASIHAIRFWEWATVPIVIGLVNARCYALGSFDYLISFLLEALRTLLGIGGRKWDS